MEIIETGITWEHDTGTIVVSTRSRRVAQRLRALGFEPEPDSRDDYETFRCTEAELGITLRRRRKATPAQRAELRARLKVDTQGEIGAISPP